jgi:hypothetical protein
VRHVRPYIVSQRHEGWQLIRTLYDDGGFSGGTIERPALKRLLEDVAAKKVDTIVVYKVDRLTRSLADFAKIVEALDKQGVSFVSVTQQFNTTTSMGRLTLNVLLSFAQFEREVTGERIRDKIDLQTVPGTEVCLEAARKLGENWRPEQTTNQQIRHGSRRRCLLSRGSLSHFAEQNLSGRDSS